MPMHRALLYVSTATSLQRARCMTVSRGKSMRRLQHVGTRCGLTRAIEPALPARSAARCACGMGGSLDRSPADYERGWICSACSSVGMLFISSRHRATAECRARWTARSIRHRIMSTSPAGTWTPDEQATPRHMIEPRFGARLAYSAASRRAEDRRAKTMTPLSVSLAPTGCNPDPTCVQTDGRFV